MDLYIDVVLIVVIIASLVIIGFIGLIMLYKRFMEWGFAQLEYKRYFSKEGAFEGESVYFIEEMTNQKAWDDFYERNVDDTKATYKIKLKKGQYLSDIKDMFI